MYDFFLYRHAWRFNLAPHQEHKLTDIQCKNLLRKSGWLVRNTYNFDQKEESQFWYIIKDDFAEMEELTSNTRRKVRKALKTYEYKKVSKSVLMQSAYENIVKPVYAAYRVKDRNISEQWFLNHIDQDEKNYDFWACFERSSGRMTGFTDVHLWADACEYRLICIHPDGWHNATYPYYGMIYSLNHYYLGEKKFKYVTDGSRSITEHSNIQSFLIQNFNFRKAYCNLNIRYKWWFGIIVKMLYPFRKIVTLPPVKAILRQEEFFRNQKN